MSALCATQQQLLNRCLTEITRFGDQFTTLLLIGKPGVGKRTIARAIADAFEMGFVEIPLTGPVGALRARLFGSEAESTHSEENQVPPGELANLNNYLVYLSELHQLPDGLHHDFQRLVTRRMYRDALGKDWRVPSDLIIIVGLTDSVSGTVTAEHWLRHQFRAEVNVIPPRSDCELLEIIRGTINDTDPTCRVCLSPNEAISLMKAAQWNLRTLIGWLNKAVTLNPPLSALNRGQIWKALEEDVEYLLSRIEYCSTTVSLGRFRNWAAQFPSELEDVPFHILKQVHNTYYISVHEFQRGIQNLVKLAGIKPRSKVVFCKWQYLGRSAPLVAYELKNRGQWLLVNELDLTCDRHDWPDLGDGSNVNFVVADDFVGSGKTLGRLFNGGTSVIRELVNHYPASRIKILLIVAYEDAICQIRAAVRNISDHINIYVHKLFDSRDQCFSENSRIFESLEVKTLFQKFCREVARKHFPPILQQYPFGFGNIASLCVFHNTVPNNSLPVIWFDKDGSGWTPLFPARGLELPITRAV